MSIAKRHTGPRDVEKVYINSKLVTVTAGSAGGSSALAFLLFVPLFGFCGFYETDHHSGTTPLISTAFCCFYCRFPVSLFPHSIVSSRTLDPQQHGSVTPPPPHPSRLSFLSSPPLLYSAGFVRTRSFCISLHQEKLSGYKYLN
jgi:hypothetical protein